MSGNKNRAAPGAVGQAPCWHRKNDVSRGGCSREQWEHLWAKLSAPLKQQIHKGITYGCERKQAGEDDRATELRIAERCEEAATVTLGRRRRRLAGWILDKQQNA